MEMGDEDVSLYIREVSSLNLVLLYRCVVAVYDSSNTHSSWGRLHRIFRDKSHRIQLYMHNCIVV